LEVPIDFQAIYDASNSYYAAYAKRPDKTPPAAVMDVLHFDALYFGDN
jgi:hypothetical protein